MSFSERRLSNRGLLHRVRDALGWYDYQSSQEPKNTLAEDDYPGTFYGFCGLGGIATGMIVGGFIGSIIPGAGTVLGMIIGGMLGFAVGLAAGHIAHFIDKKVTQKKIGKSKKDDSDSIATKRLLSDQKPMITSAPSNPTTRQSVSTTLSGFFGGLFTRQHSQQPPEERNPAYEHFHQL